MNEVLCIYEVLKSFIVCMLLLHIKIINGLIWHGYKYSEKYSKKYSDGCVNIYKDTWDRDKNMQL